MAPAYVSTLTALTILVLLLAFRAIQHAFLSGESLRGDLRGGNMARALLHAGDLLGLFWIGASTVSSCARGESWAQDVLWIGVFGGSALVLFVLFARLGVRALLGARLPRELGRGNGAAGLAAGAHSAATGLIVARSMGGTDVTTYAASLLFFVLAHVSLHAFIAFYRALTEYDDGEQIVEGNLAAALSYAGVTMAVALIVGHAVEGPFLGLLPSLRAFALALLYGFALYPVRQLVVGGIFVGARPTLRGGVLDGAIGRSRNVGLGALEASAYLATALAVVRLP